MKFKSIFIISLIFCVFLTFSTVNAIDLDNSLDDADLTTSPSESIKLNVSELKSTTNQLDLLVTYIQQEQNTGSCQDQMKYSSR